MLLRGRGLSEKEKQRSYPAGNKEGLNHSGFSPESPGE